MKKSAFCILGLVVVTACSSHPRGPNADEVPESVAIGQATITSGFAIGKIKSTRSVDSLRIGRTPITVARYAQCVAVGACNAPSRRRGMCAALDEGSTRSPDAAETCVDVGQARAYCAWLGGGLPTFDEWQLAARGPDVHRYAWGDAAPNCTQHPGGTKKSSGPACPEGDAWLVGKHSAGASPSGVEDVEMTYELLSPQSDAVFPACRGESGCIVGGLDPGAIDWVTPAVGSDEADLFAFRCATGGGR